MREDSEEVIISRIWDNHGKEVGYEQKGVLVRCKDCKWFSQTTLGMDYACWRGAEQVWGETGEHKGQRVCVRLKDGNDYCSYGEREERDHE